MEQQHGSSNKTAGNTDLVSHEDIQERDKGEEPILDSEQHNDLGEEEVHVLYLNVPPSDEPQVLDLSNLLAQEGIQVIESSDTVSLEQISSNTHVHGAQEIVIENEDATEVVMVTSQSETQSAHALLGLSKSQTEGGHIQVSDILAAHHHSEHVMNVQEQSTPVEALLQLSTDPSTGTYIVDETGTMVPNGQIRSSTLFQLEDTGVTTIAICQCWCGREFISQEDLNRHKLAHRYQNQGRMHPGMQKCTLCLESFLSNKDLRTHHAEFHPGGMPWECNICHRTFHKKIAMKAHMRVHNTLTRYQCSSCKKVFFYKTALSRHLKMHSCEKPFKCTICGEMYHSLWDLRKHRTNHQPPKLFACDICTKVFKQKQTLFVHSRIHTGQKPYSCEVCHRNFSLKSTLVQHRRIHTGEKPNVCHICQRAFRQNSTLKAHLKTHTNLKPFMCRYCKMRFAYRDEVTEHEHTHANNKTWQCDDCGMWFKNQSLLTRHSRVHTNERPFQCNVCYKSFVQSGSLQSHMRSHTKEKPYQCRICSKAYYTSGTLLVHIRKFHNVDAKSVKEVFPVYNYIEDQKIFTIRNSLLSDLKPVITDTDQDEATTADKSNLDDLLSKDNAIVEELVETSDEIIVQDSRILHERVISDVHAEVQIVETVDSSSSQCREKHDMNAGETAVKECGRVKVGNENDMKTLLSIKTVQREVTDGLDTEEGGQDEAAQSSHAAHDRQEAALGLAELSLTGGEGLLLEKQPQAKTRTFFKEEEEDENDPHVTKIILSKEGGIMNSQDPHQCPVCGRIFGRKSIMIEHIRIHTDEKPYECDFCQASFRQNAQLRSHIRNNHTQVERYQCSFCHNRFLSRSITIRHINFHHKLKIKFCQNMDPAWTVDSAVWSDDNFELSVSNPQFLKVSKKKKTSIKGSHDSVLPSGRSSEALQKVASALPVEAHNKYAVKVSVLPSELDSIIHPEDSEKIHKDITDEKSGLSSIPLVNSDPLNDINKIVSSAPGELSFISSTNIQENKAELSSSLDQSPAAPVSITSAETAEVSRSTEIAADVRTSVETKSENSRLICKTCAMQFRGISSLRYHSRKVHNKTLDQSDVSYVCDSVSTQNSEHQRETAAEVHTSKVNVAHSKQEVNVIGSGGNGSLKIVVYDDSKKCVDEPPKLNLPYVCVMCDQRYSSKVSLEEHLKCHSEEDVESVSLHRCDLCASVMKNTQQVTKHILKFHGVKQIYVCSICHREFYQQSSVYRHMKFLHKWEIKIRGEASIPVFVKPAPLSMHAPSNTPIVKVGKESFIDHTKKPVTKLSSYTDNNVTYINLEIDDMENLKIFKSYGQEVLFEVVDSDDKLKAFQIKESDSKIQNTSQKSLTSVPVTSESLESLNNEQSTSTPKLNLISGDLVTSLDSPITSLASGSSVSCKTKEVITPADSRSFIVVDSDTSAQKQVSKQIISQLLTALSNSSHENKTDSTGVVSKVITIKHLNNALNHPETVSSTSSPSQNSSNTPKFDLKVREEDLMKKCTNLPNSTNFKSPIIMSVKDIGATYAGFEPKLGQQSTSEITSESTSTVMSDTENTSISVMSMLASVDNVDNLDNGGLCFLPKTETKFDQNMDIHFIQLEETKSRVVDQDPKANFVEGIQETVNATKTQISSCQSSEIEVINKCEKVVKDNSGGKTIRSFSVTAKATTQPKIVHLKDNIKVEIPDNTRVLEHKLVSSNKKKTDKKTSSVMGLSQKGHMNSHNSTKVVQDKVQAAIPLSRTYVTFNEQTKEKVSLSRQITNSDSKHTLDGKTSLTKKNIKNVPAMKNSDKPSVYRSSSGRLIKRKRFDDEIEEVKRGKK